MPRLMDLKTLHASGTALLASIIPGPLPWDCLWCSDRRKEFLPVSSPWARQNVFMPSWRFGLVSTGAYSAGRFPPVQLYLVGLTPRRPIRHVEI